MISKLKVLVVVVPVLCATAIPAQTPTPPSPRVQRAVIPKRAVLPGSVARIENLARPKVFHGNCPATIRWTAKLHLKNMPVTVDYQWERSDGATGPKEHVVMTKQLTEISDTWQLGGPGEHYNVWEKLHVLSPNNISSSTPVAKITCFPPKRSP